MSNMTFDFFSIKTVPSNYSWDLGTPQVEFFDFITDVSLVTAQSNNSEQVEYVGYAPFVSVSLSSFAGTPSLSSIAVRRIADFGDYYNSESNFTSSPTLSNEVYCHNYIMPGLYTIKLTKVEYVEIDATSYSAFSCVERYCMEWSWKKLDCTSPLDPTVTWSDTLTGESYEKRWTDRPEEVCDAVWANSQGLYVQPEQQVTRFPLSWQWYNFLCQSLDNPKNTPVTWNQSIFQGQEQLIWSGVSGPCLEFANKEANWVWNSVTCDLTANPLANSTTWDQTKCDSSTNKTWDSIAGNCTEKVPTLSAKEETIVHEAMIRVLEIPPTAYLQIEQPLNPNDRISPLTVRISPRFTKAGSFPIEKIVWDLGDGSPLLTQRRWSPNSDSPFVFSDIYNLDWQDPRNYDVIHTYRKTPESGFSFYPSITAYSSSTGTTDCASVVVGPLKLSAFVGSSISLLQNELTDSGKIVVGEIDNGVAVWKIDN